MNPKTKKQLVIVLKVILGLIIGGSIAGVLSSFRHQLVYLADVQWPALTVAFVFCIAYRIINAHGWAMILRAFKEQISCVDAARIWLSSEACRWLPGSVWGFGSRALQAKKKELARPRPRPAWYWSCCSRCSLGQSPRPSACSTLAKQ